MAERYANGKIYRLVNSVDNDEYVGSTCTSLAKRKSIHKKDARTQTTRRVYQHLNEVGWDNVDIVLIEEYPCENKMELEIKERYWIETLKPSLNKRVPTRSNQEYRQENADTIHEQRAKYRAENADKERERVAKWQVENADKVREKQAKWRAENADKERERHAKYRAENCDKVREGRAKYREANREALNAKERERRASKKTEHKTKQTT